MKIDTHILFSRLLQLLFHPFAVVCYAAIVAIECNMMTPFYVPSPIKNLLIQLFVWILCIFPMLSILILKRRNVISSYTLLSVSELNPVIGINSFFFLVAAGVLHTIEAPFVLYIIPLLALLTFLFYYMVNLKLRLNIYIVSLSALLGYFIHSSIEYNYNLLPAIIATILIIGIVNYSFIEDEVINLKESLTSMAAGLFISLSSLFLMS